MGLIRWKRRVYIMRKEGRGYYMGSLPRDWAITHSLAESREVEVLLNGDGTLTIIPVKKSH